MRNRTFHTSVNLLIEPDCYSRLKKAKMIKKTSMSKIIRQGILLILDKIDKESNAVIVEKDEEANCNTCQDGSKHLATRTTLPL